MRIINEVKRIVEEELLQPFIYATEYNINEQVLNIADQLPCVAMVRQTGGQFEHQNGIKDSCPCLIFFVGLAPSGETDIKIAETVAAEKVFAKKFLRAVEKSSVIFSNGADNYQDFFDRFDVFNATGVFLQLTLKELAEDIECPD